MKKCIREIPKDYDTVVLMEKLCSSELLWGNHYELRRVLDYINICIKKREIWGINGKSLFDIKLLLEIMANIKPYYSGKCVLFEHGMMQQKRIILPRVFYAGTPTMIYDNMNVLEFLMFITANRKGNIITRQKEIFNFLQTVGLGNISLSPIYSLTKEYKSIIILISGFFSASELIIFNYPDYIYSDKQRESIYIIVGLLKNTDRTLVLSSTDSETIGRVCSHTAYLINGKIVYAGTIDNFCKTYDKIILTIWDKNTQGLQDVLSQEFPQYQYNLSDGSLVISGHLSDENDLNRIYKVTADTGFTPDKVYVNPKTVKNACEEIVRQYDLQE